MFGSCSSIIFLCFFFLFCIFINSDSPSAFKCIFNNVEFIFNKIDNKTVDIRSFIRKSEISNLDFFFPSYVYDQEKNKYEVVSIYDRSFDGSPFDSITFPSSIKTIGTFAFFNTKKLNKIDLSQTKITKIPNNCFQNSSIQILLIPNTLKIIEEYSFDHSQLKEIVLPKNFCELSEFSFSFSSLKNIDLSVTKVKIFPSFCFYFCSSLETIKFPINLEIIQRSCFQYSSIKSLPILPQSILEIGVLAFADCSLNEIDLSETKITQLPEKLFFNCYNLISIILPKIQGTNYTFEIKDHCFANSKIEEFETHFIYKFGKSVFQNCTNLKKLIITSNEFKVIPELFCENCSKLNDFYFSNNIQIIKENAFKNTGFSSLLLPSSLNFIEESAFSSCTKLKIVNLSMTNISILAENTFKLSISLQKVLVPKTLEFIGENCFKLTNLTSILLPFLFKEFSSFAFNTCLSLEKIDLRNTQITKFNSYTFFHCYNLTEIIFPITVNYISSFAFYSTRITKFELLPPTFINSKNIPSQTNTLNENNNESINNSINHIENKKLYDNNENLENLENINPIEESLLELEPSAFQGLEELLICNFSQRKVFHLPNQCFEDCSKLEEIIIIPFYETIGDYCFYNTSISMFNLASIMEIGKYSFANCFKLNYVAIKTKFIEEGCFSNCTNLKLISLSTNLQAIRSKAFYNCRISRLIINNTNLYKIDSFAFSSNVELEIFDIKNTNVREISFSLFENCIKLKRVVFPDELETIAPYAFANTAIASINFKDFLLKIGEFCFKNCFLLEEVNLKDTRIEVLSNSLFINCISLINVKLPDTLSSFNEYCFKNCSSLSEFRFSQSVRTIERGVFSFCTNLETVDCSVLSVEYIGDEMFYSCTKLSKIILSNYILEFRKLCFSQTGFEFFIIPQTIQKVEESSFENCKFLKYLYLNESRNLILLGRKAFYNCPKLHKIVFSNSIEEIGDYCLSFCHLKSIILPTTIRKIGKYCFSNNNYLKTVDVSHSSIKEFDSFSEGLFCNCTILNEIIFTQEFSSLKGHSFQTNKKQNSSKSKNFNENKTETSKISKALLHSINSQQQLNAEITRNNRKCYIKSFGKSCFENTGFEIFVIPSSVKCLDEKCFHACKYLKYLDISLTKCKIIPKNCFSYCKKLNCIKLSSFVQIFGETCFKATGFNEFEVPSNISHINSKAFKKCTKLESISFLSSNIEVISDSVLCDCFSLSSINFNENKIKTIESKAFKNCYSLKRISFSSPLLSEIGNYSFYSCITLTEIDLSSSSIKKLESHTFYNNSKLENIVFPSSLQIIAQSCFAFCIKLSFIDLLNTQIIKLCSSCFISCTNLNSIGLPSSLKIIEEKAFHKCEQIKYFLYCGTGNELNIQKPLFTNANNLNIYLISNQKRNMKNFDPFPITLINYCPNSIDSSFSSVFQIINDPKLQNSTKNSEVNKNSTFITDNFDFIFMMLFLLVLLLILTIFICLYSRKSKTRKNNSYIRNQNRRYDNETLIKKDSSLGDFYFPEAVDNL